MIIVWLVSTLSLVISGKGTPFESLTDDTKLSYSNNHLVKQCIYRFRVTGEYDNVENWCAIQI